MKDLPIFYLMILGLVVTAFVLELGLFPFLPKTIIDYRWSKEAVAITFAGAIFLIGIFNGHSLKCKNIWILLLLLYFLIHPFIAPNYQLEMFFMNIGGFWEYKPMLYAFLYFGMFCVVSNLRLAPGHVDDFLKILMWVGVISCGYVWIQYFHLDQFQHPSENRYLIFVTNEQMTATFTQPNYAAAFIALCAPIAFYFRRGLPLVLMIATTLLINSKMAIAAMTIGVGYLLFKRSGIVTAFVFSLIGIILAWVWLSYPVAMTHDWSSSGRFQLWHRILHDCKEFFLTGHGLGAYRFVWVSQHPGAMGEAHNEWIQLLFDGGFVADLLLFFSIFWLLKGLKFFTIVDSQTNVLIAVFLGFLICSLGLFIWQIEPHRYLAVVIFALLHNKLNREKGEGLR